jgi:hypothetical protein
MNGRRVKEPRCRIQARTTRKLSRIPPEYEHLRLESVAPDVTRHPGQPVVWRAVRSRPESSYPICGGSGAGKTAVLWGPYHNAVERRRPAVAFFSLAELLEDYKRAKTARHEDGYAPELHPSELQTRSGRWFVGIDDFHIGRPSRFAGEMIYRLVDAAYTYRRQLVITSQIDRGGIERRWAEAGAGYGEAILRRVLGPEGAGCLTLYEGYCLHGKSR